MLDLKPVLFINGLMLTVLGGGMIIPALIDLGVSNPDWQVFAAAALTTIFCGVALQLANRGDVQSLSARQGFLLTVLAWLALPAFGALPIAFADLDANYTDAYFEAMSGLTATGATVLTGLDTTPPGILMWRALLNWFGGVGIIVMALSVLPALQVAGYQMFRMESSDNSEKIVPRVAQLANVVAIVYVGLTVVCLLSYWIAGMTFFDAVCHAFATVSTGGFSTSDKSLAVYPSPYLHWIVTIFMAMAALPFTLYFKALRGQPMALLKDNQVQLYFSLLVGFTVLVTLWYWKTFDVDLMTALSHSAFSVTAVMTGSGFAVTDYQLWGSFAFGVFFMITFLGGCAGSSAGGIKMFRIWILFSLTRAQLRKLLRPHSLFVARYNGRPVALSTVGSVVSFFFLFIVSFLVFTMLLMATGLDLVTAASGAATSLANVGPGLGEIIGPAGTFQPLPDTAKWILSLAMMMGRLELYTVLVLMTPAFWRD